MTTTTVRGGGRLAVVTAVAGTALIAAGAFWLSFTSLTDLARRSGIDAGQAWAWPLIVDGIIVVATVAVVALAGTRQAWYPWLLLICGAGLSVTANSIHALVAADADVPGVLAASVAAVPPVVLLAITHLTVILTRRQTAQAHSEESFAAAEEGAALPVSSAVASANFPLPPIIEARPAVPESPRAVPGGRGVAEALRAEGWSNKKIARHLGVHASTVGRWFTSDDSHVLAVQVTEPAGDDLEPELDPESDLDDEEKPS